MIERRRDHCIGKFYMDEFKYTKREGFQNLVNIFDDHGFKLRIVGGAVRDMLLGKTPIDIDFVTNATVIQMKLMFHRKYIATVHPKGEEHGTVTAKMNDKETYEITTLRINIEHRYRDEWQMDASKRDFTINAMSLTLDGDVYDYFNGYNHLRKKKVIFVGDPVERIEEDYIRIFRYFRFYGKIAKHPYRHNPKVIIAIKETVKGLKDINGQRIWTEWKKILRGNFGMEMTLKLINCGAGQYCGLPFYPSRRRFRRIYQECKDKKTETKRLLSSLLNNKGDRFELEKRLEITLKPRDLNWI
ncbi:CCA tRNA nucleotidyltransferase 1, mitochondrial-like isoform X2 [Prorops nasuta]